MTHNDFTYFEHLLSERILILDGAMGTMIQRHNLTEIDFRGESPLTPDCNKGIFAGWEVRLQGNNDLISLTRPDVLRGIHRSYLEAGADIIETNTFNAQRVSQADYRTEGYVRQINEAAVRIAREEADRMSAVTPHKPRFVAASIGPTNRTLSMSPDVDNPSMRTITFDQLRDAYEEQMIVLSNGGVDLWLIETIFDTLNAKAALAAARNVKRRTGRRIPVMLSATISDASGRTLSGQTLDALLASVAHDNDILSVGLNCSFGAEDMRPYLRELATNAPFHISAHPNAGLPDEDGNYSETPQLMAKAIGIFIDDGSVNIVGGCCGSTPEHIKAIAAAAHGRSPRPKPQKGHVAWLSGLEGYTPLPHTFVNVGERCNVAGSRKFLRLIKEKQYDEALSIARKQVRDGASMLDINMDDGMLDTAAEMTEFLNLMASDPEVARIPWMIDSSRFEVIEAALKCVQGKCVVNSISLKAGEKRFVEQARAIREYGAAVVVMAFDEEGQATTYERKIQVCARAYRLLTEMAGYNPRDIIFDPNVLTVATGIKEHDRYAIDFIKATGWITERMPHVHVSGGVSNLSFAFRGNNYLREAMHAVFLYHSIQHGMDMGIVNPASKVMYGDIAPDLLEAIEDVILCRRDDAAERLSEKAQRLIAAKDDTEATETDNASIAERMNTPIGERLTNALRTGNDEWLEADMQEAIEQYATPGAIIEGPLMQGMQLVGRLFGEGKMFLPQVVKSARTMKKAVQLLQPYLEQSRQTSTRSNGRYLVATVKGDVHDIGKNIVAVVMGCNNFDVVDLGVMVTPEKIVQAITDMHIDYVALSGLITPSLDEMCRTAEAMNKAGIDIPLFIGGATTSELHTALRIAPLYGGPVFHVRDASQNPVLTMQLAGHDRNRVIDENRKRQAELVRRHEAKKHQGEVAEHDSTASFHARAINGCQCGCDSQGHKIHRPHIDWSKERLPKPSYVGYRWVPNIAITQVRQLINWTFFYKLWHVHPGSTEAAHVKAEAEAMLDQMERRHSMQAQVGFYQANGTSHSIVLHGAVNGHDMEIPTPRQNARQGTDSALPQLSLCDFVAPAPLDDYVGVFAVTVSPSFAEDLEHLKRKEGNGAFRSLLMQSIGDRLAEAASEWLHREVRTRLWGYSPNERLTPVELSRAAYQGIRPAIGYPSLPDVRLIFPVSRLLDFKSLGIQLTENGAMYPQSSICGLYLSNPHARYFMVSTTEEKL